MFLSDEGPTLETLIYGKFYIFVTFEFSWEKL